MVKMLHLDEVEVFLDKMIIKSSEPLNLMNSGLLNTYTTEIVDEKTFVFYFNDHEKFLNELLASFVQK